MPRVAAGERELALNMTSAPFPGSACACMSCPRRLALCTVTWVRTQQLLALLNASSSRGRARARSKYDIRAFPQAAPAPARAAPAAWRFALSPVSGRLPSWGPIAGPDGGARSSAPWTGRCCSGVPARSRRVRLGFLFEPSGGSRGRSALTQAGFRARPEADSALPPYPLLDS